MEWRDQGIILSARKHSETSVIVELLSRTQGRHMGLVRGGRSRQNRPLLQPGNKVEAYWHARLETHLGLYRLEPVKSRAAAILEQPDRLLALQSVCVLLRVLAEREPHERLYLSTDLLLSRLGAGESWQSMLVHWELQLLAELGYGLDLSCCAATGSHDNLIFVSPKSARAVSAEAGAPYKDKMLVLPSFVLAHELEVQISSEDFAAGLHLSGYFLEKHLYSPHEKGLPDVRLRLAAKT